MEVILLGLKIASILFFLALPVAALAYMHIIDNRIDRLTRTLDRLEDLIIDLYDDDDDDEDEEETPDIEPPTFQINKKGELV